MKSPTNWATDGYFFLFDLVFVPPDNGTQSHDPSHGLLHAHAPLHVAGHANGSSAAPGWFVRMIHEGIKGLANVAAYLDDIIVFDPDPCAHVLTIVGMLKQLRKHNLKLLSLIHI